MRRPAVPPAIQISGPEGRMDNYIRAVERAGGAPVPGYAPEPDSHCLGLVLCGGGDLDPAWFGQKDRGSHPPDSRRDAAELALVRTWLSWGRPILGICRGMQVINVALGGNLFQDLGAERAALHQGEEDVFHPVRTAPGSLLEGLFGENAPCARRLGPGRDAGGAGAPESPGSGGAVPPGAAAKWRGRRPVPLADGAGGPTLSGKRRTSPGGTYTSER